MRSLYTPPELDDARKRADGKQLMVWGVMLGGAGIAGVIVSKVLKAIWLGILGGPIGALSGLAVLGGIGLFVWGFLMVRGAHRPSDY